MSSNSHNTTPLHHVNKTNHVPNSKSDDSNDDTAQELDKLNEPLSIELEQPTLRSESNCCRYCRSPHSGTFCLCLACVVILLLVVTVITAITTFLLKVDSLVPNLKTTGQISKQKFFQSPSRCFQFCEPDDLLHREDKLMKPIVAHDGIKPTRYFLYLFPPEPTFGEEVGEPAYLTEYIRLGQLKEGKERARVKGLQWRDLESYAGFFTISYDFDSHLYFWFFPSQSDPSSDPLILWLQVCFYINSHIVNTCEACACGLTPRTGLPGGVSVLRHFCFWLKRQRQPYK